MERSHTRVAVDGDSLAIATLLGHLGYITTADEARARLGDMSDPRHNAILVAEHHDRVIGLAALHCIPLLHEEGRVGRLSALVVDPSAHRTGVGRALLEAVEAFAREAGCSRIEVTSGPQRRGAHAFYRTFGFQRSEHHRFLKPIV